MSQRAQGIVEYDRETVVFRTASSRRPLLAALPVAVILAAIVFVGVTGNHETGDRPWAHQLTPPPAPAGGAGLVAGASTAGSASLAAEAPTPYPLMPIPTSAVPGYKQIRPRASDVSQAPIGEMAWPLASDGRVVLYADGQQLYSIGMPSAEAGAVEVANVGPCGFIVGAAISGNQIAYVEIEPAPLSPDAAGGCPAWGARMTWRIGLVNIKTGDRSVGATGDMATTPEVSSYQLASLYRSAVGASPATIPHVAVSQEGYAFSVPAPEGTDSVVQVRSFINETTLIVSSVPGDVTQLLLGGIRLVVVTRDPFSQTMSGSRTVYSANPLDSTMTYEGRTSGLASLSPNGERLTYPACDDGGRCGDLGVSQQGVATSIKSPFPAGATATTDASGLVWAPRSGYATIDYLPYFLLQDSRFPDGAAIVTAAPVVWVAYDGDILVWAELSNDDVVTLYSMDVSLVAVYQP